jgi:hypothetical protein
MSTYALTSQVHAGAANSVVDAIRRQVAVRKDVLNAARGRRDRVRELADEHEAAGRLSTRDLSPTAPPTPRFMTPTAASCSTAASSGPTGPTATDCPRDR